MEERFVMKIDKGTVIVGAAILGCVALFWYLTKKAKAIDEPPVDGGGSSGIDNSNQAAIDAENALKAAQAAAQDAAVQAAAEAAAKAEAANAAAQTAASAAAADKIKRDAAAAAQAEADRQRAAFEASCAAQLADVTVATAAAKAACDIALSCYNAAVTDLQTQQAVVNNRMANTPVCVELYSDVNLKGACNTWGVGEYPSFSGMNVGNDKVSSFLLHRGFTLIGYKDSNFLSFMQIWHADGTTDLSVNMANTELGNDQMSSCKVLPCPSTYAAILAFYQDKINQIKINLGACKSSLNLCIEREMSVYENIQTYNILEGQLSTISGSLIALRTYVGNIPV
jgi:hypothetical protein